MLLSVANVSKSFGVDVVLTDVSFRLERREKVALVGRNGAGKTTLLRILTGEQEPDGGSVKFVSGARVGYLSQSSPVTGDHTVMEEARSAVEDRLRVVERLREVEQAIERDATTELLDEYAWLQERFHEDQGHSAETDLRTTLKRMGFEEEDWDRPASDLSGGQRTRLALARLLLQGPDLLILDEPTNHLDLEATEWLEGWVRKYDGTVLLVSHDRRFLEATSQRTLEMVDGTVKSYPGGFEKFLKLRQEELERMAELAKRQDREIAKLDEYVRRFMNSQRTAQARGRLKRMEKLEAQRVQAPRSERSMAAGFGKAARSGDLALVCEGLEIGYDEPLTQPIDWTVRWQERWGVVGENGAGKSTLVRTAIGKIDALDGRSKLGSNVEVGYFAQDAESLDMDRTPLEHMVWRCDMESAAARDLLGRFLFSGDDVERKIGNLSGGERNKLALAELTHQAPNLLVLDEPTNHLDMDSREALAAVLADYDGTLILVSHDRWLLESICDRTLDVRKEGVVDFPGGYLDYRASRRRTESKTTKGSSAASESESDGLTPRELSKKILAVEKAVIEREEAVHRLESEVARVEGALAAPPSDEAELFELTQSYGKLKTDLESAMVAWEEAEIELESLRERQGGR